jgi:hypothetical protein
MEAIREVIVPQRQQRKLFATDLFASPVFCIWLSLVSLAPLLFLELS